jgi:hypothetical protein
VSLHVSDALCYGNRDCRFEHCPSSCVFQKSTVACLGLFPLSVTKVHMPLYALGRTIRYH